MANPRGLLVPAVQDLLLTPRDVVERLSRTLSDGNRRVQFLLLPRQQLEEGGTLPQRRAGAVSQ